MARLVRGSTAGVRGASLPILGVCGVGFEVSVLSVGIGKPDVKCVATSAKSFGFTTRLSFVFSARCCEPFNRFGKTVTTAVARVSS